MTILLLAAILAAQATGPVEIWTRSDLKSSAGGLADESEARGIAGKTLGSYGSHSASLWRRSKSGEAELHKTKADVIVIEEGSATLVYGGTIHGAHTTQVNEIRGKSIDGGTSKKVAPGDVIRIAPNTPHQFVLDKGQWVAYFALKLAR